MNKQNKILINVGVIVFTILISITTYLLLPKKVTLVIDNDKEEVTTNYVFASDFISNYVGVESDYIVADNNAFNLLALNKSIKIQTKKNINVIVGTEEKKVSTYVNNSNELLKDLKLINSDMNSYSLFAEDKNIKLANDLTIRINHIYYKSIEVEEEKHLDIVYKNNSNMYVGVSNVTANGIPEKSLNTYNIKYQNGIEVEKVLDKSKVISEGVAKVIEKGTKVYVPSKVSISGDISVWNSLAQCESSGNWSMDSGNGYYGGLQFSYDTWLTASKAVGVNAPYAHMASKEEQILAATWLQKQYGWGQWPACSKRLGL